MLKLVALAALVIFSSEILQVLVHLNAIIFLCFAVVAGGKVLARLTILTFCFLFPLMKKMLDLHLYLIYFPSKHPRLVLTLLQLTHFTRTASPIPVLIIFDIL